jgi:hypothetical protein
MPVCTANQPSSSVESRPEARAYPFVPKTCEATRAKFRPLRVADRPSAPT